MPYKHKPRTDREILASLRSAKNKADNLGPGQVRAFSQATYDRLALFLPRFENRVNTEGVTLSAQIKVSAKEQKAMDFLGMVMSQFFQGLNFAVKRGAYDASVRAFYGLHANQDTVPELTKKEDMDFWYNKLVLGENNRQLDGGTPMSNPDIGEVSTAYSDWDTLRNDQSEKKDNHDVAQEAIEDLREEALELITDIWDEIEFFFRKESGPSKRRKAKEYGVKYVNRKGEETEEDDGDDEEDDAPPVTV